MKDRLYVPEHFCTDAIISAYQTQIQIGKDPLTEEALYQTFSHFTRITINQNESVIAFNRGDMRKLRETFHDFQIVDQRAFVPMVHPLKIVFPPGKSWRDYQPEAVAALDSDEYGILKAPPRSGKTLMMTGAICMGRQRTIVFAHQTDLLLQLYDTIEEYTNVLELRQKTGDGIVGFAESWEDFGKYDIVLCTKQTFDHPNNRYRVREIQELFGAVYVDETHFVGAEVYSKLINYFPAAVRHGVTATPKRKDGMDLLMESVMGPVIHEITADQVGQVPMEVVTIPTGVASRSTQWAKMLTELAANETRNELILKDMEADARAGHTLIAVTDRKNHGIYLAKTLTERGIPAVVFNGSLTDKNRRKQLLNQVRNREAQVMIGMRSMTTGLDIPRADYFYNLLPCANAVKDGEHQGEGGYEQQITRVRTPFPGKLKCVVKDYVDRMGIAYACLKQREKTYRKVGAKLSRQHENEPAAMKAEAGSATGTSFGMED